MVMVMVMKRVIILISIAHLAAGQRRRFLKDVIEKIRNSPKHNSISPSFNGERQFEVIGTGRLPLEDHSFQLQKADIFHSELRNLQRTTEKPVTSFLGNG